MSRLPALAVVFGLPLAAPLEFAMASTWRGARCSLCSWARCARIILNWLERLSLDRSAPASEETKLLSGLRSDENRFSLVLLSWKAGMIRTRLMLGDPHLDGTYPSPSGKSTSSRAACRRKARHAWLRGQIPQVWTHTAVGARRTGLAVLSRHDGPGEAARLFFRVLIVFHVFSSFWVTVSLLSCRDFPESQTLTQPSPHHAPSWNPLWPPFPFSESSSLCPSLLTFAPSLAAHLATSKSLGTLPQTGSQGPH